MVRKAIGSSLSNQGNQANRGPFISPSGDGADIYGIFALSDAAPVVYKSGTDPLVDTWTEQDASNNPVDAGAGGLWVHQAGSLLHIITEDKLGDPGKGDVSYHVFNTNSDTWTTVDTDIVSGISATNAPDLGVTCWIYVQTDGDIIAVVSGEKDNVKGTRYNRVDFFRSTNSGTSFGTAIAIDDAGENDYNNPCGVGVGNRAHVVYHERLEQAGDRTCQHKTIRDDDSLSTVTDNIVVITPPGGGQAFGVGVHYDDGGTERVRIPVKVNADGTTHVIVFDDEDSPTVTEVAAGDSEVRIATSQTLAVDGKTVILLYSRNSDQDLIRDENIDDAGWGTDTVLEGSITSSSLSSRVYDRSGTKHAYIYSDTAASEMFYNEEDLGGAPATPLTVSVGDAMSMADAVAAGDKLMTMSLAPADTMTMAEDIALFMSMALAPADQIVMTDQAELFMTMALEVTDQIVLTDQAELLMTMSLSFGDAMTMADAVTAQLGVQASAADAMTMSDDIELFMTMGIEVTDQIVMTDAIDLFMSMALEVTDQIVFSDQAELLMTMALEVDDTMTMTDAVVVSLGVFTSVAAQMVGTLELS